MSAAERVAIVTGASQGMGAGIVRQLLAKGYRVVACSRKVATTGQPNLVEIAGDISQPETASLLVQTAKERFGRVDTLINNAGVFVPKPFTEYTESEFATLLQVNLGGFFHVSQRAIAEMLRQANGHIVNITSSLLAEQPLKGLPAALTAITKGGINAVTRSLAIEYADKGIRVNAVAPGASALRCMRSIRMRSLQPCIQWAHRGDFRRSSTRFSISKMQPLSPERFCTSMAAPTQGAGDPVKISD